MLYQINQLKINNMFCYQCQETAKGTGCTIRGICGKDEKLAGLQDKLIYEVRRLSVYSTLAEKADVELKNQSEINKAVIDGLFSTITNADFDYESIEHKAETCRTLIDQIIELLSEAEVELPEVSEEDWLGVLSEKNEDIRSLRELSIYGIKGMAAYVEHAMNLGFDDPLIHKFIQTAFYDMTVKDLSAEDLTALVLKTGEYGVKGMALLDKANTESYGNPEITKVELGVRKNPAILISGHDLRDMEQLLEQTQGTGVDVYTHGEMLPAHYYPAFKKYKNFVGNYGNSWWKQREEFESFNGPILMTTNCIVPLSKKNTYLNRLYTTGATGLPGAMHIDGNKEGIKDFSEIIAQAKRLKSPDELETGSIVGGFAHDQVFKLAGPIVEAVKSGAIKQFVVMAGCDGRMKSREYYTDYAKALPKDMVILTAGCAKYRYNKLGLGDINGIPRVLDAGQCNDSYSLALIALKLKEIFELNDINELPITYNIAWYEQKAVIVLLALLFLGVKNIHIGPTLPGFVSPGILKVLVDNFGLGTISTVEEDINSIN